MIRRLSLLAAVVWMIGATFVWPGGQPVGETLLSAGASGESMSIRGFDRQGRMVVSPLHAKQVVWPTGPLTLHDAKTGKQLSTLYSGLERIEAVRIDQRLAITRTGTSIRLVSFDDQVLIEHPGKFQGRDNPAQLSPGGTRFIAHDGLKLTMYDVATAKALWSRGDAYRAAWSGDDVLFLRLEGDSTDWQAIAADGFVRAKADSGELSPGNSMAFTEAHEGALSPDGRFVFWLGTGLEKDPPPGLYELETNRLLWGAETARRNGFPAARAWHLRFSSDSSELHYFYREQEHRFGTARWRVRDGECLTSLPPNARMSSARDSMAIAPDQTWTACSRSETQSLIGPVPAFIWKGPAWLTNAVSERLMKSTDLVELCDNVNNRILATIPELGFSLAADPDGSGLFLHSTPQITRYEVPPKMEYDPFWYRAGLPAAMILGAGELLRRLWKRLRQRKTQVAVHC